MSCTHDTSNLPCWAGTGRLGPLWCSPPVPVEGHGHMVSRTLEFIGTAQRGKLAAAMSYSSLSPGRRGGRRAQRIRRRRRGEGEGEAGTGGGTVP